MEALSVGSLFSSFGGAAGGASALGSAGGAGGLSSLLSSPTLMSMGSLGSSGLQMYTSMKNAKLQSSFLKAQAMQEQLNARQIELDAEEQSNNVRRKLLDDMASASAFFAARGMNSSGTALQAEITSRRNATEDLNSIMRKGTTKARGMRAQAEQTMFEAKATRKRGLLNAMEAMPTALESGASLFGAVKGAF